MGAHIMIIPGVLKTYERKKTRKLISWDMIRKLLDDICGLSYNYEGEPDQPQTYFGRS